MYDAATLHKEMFDVVRSRDFTKLRSLYHDDYSYMAGDGKEIASADAGVEVAEMYTRAFPDLEFTIRNHWSPAPDVSIIEFTAHGTHKEDLPGIPATGRKVDMVVCNIIETREGKILREREYFDQAAMLIQLGVMEG